MYRARDLETGHIVALKVLTLDRPFDLVRFGREATLLARVQHPNVVDYVAHGEAEGVHFLVQEWVEGVTLAEKLHTDGITASEAVAMAIGLAGALEATHALGIIHRDIKPANIILADDQFDRVKLVDFGIARLTSDAGVLTRTGRLVGTPSYMAPEQARGSINLEPAADIWSFGCVLYETLSGRVAFDGRSPAAVRAKVLLYEPPDLAPLCPEAPYELLDLVRAMLSKDPTKRPASGPELIARLRGIPPIEDDTRRRVGGPEPATVAMPIRPARRTTIDEQAAGCFVLVAPVDAPAAGSDESVARVAEKHQMEVHVFDDGSSLLVAQRTGKEAAVEAARAALALREAVPDGAVSVFSRATEDSLADAIDRGSALLERGMMGTLFGDLADEPEHEEEHVEAARLNGHSSHSSSSHRSASSSSSSSSISSSTLVGHGHENGHGGAASQGGGHTSRDQQVVYIDEGIAALISSDMPVATTVDGPVLRVVRPGSSQP